MTGLPTLRGRADRLGFLIDTADYFAAFADAVAQARRSVAIIGWEIDSGIRLWRDNGGPNDRPPELAAYLSSVLEDRPELTVHALCWDWSMVYTLEREPFPRQTMGRQTHPRLVFELDGQHPLGASHHEKLVVIDDRLAFIGGMDLGRRRWDTRRHHPEDGRRVSPAGHDYRPFHDVMAAVSGPVAQILGDRARERWHRATGDQLERPEPGDSDPWPAELEVALQDVDVGIVRTDPTESLRETESWHLEALRSARRLVYLENQYVTSRAVGDALNSALARDPGPEIVIVTSRSSSGWLEQNTMDARRARILRQLRDQDADERYSAWWPDIGNGESPTVHTKLTMIDDELAYLGSANLSNRSMGLDTESGLVLDGRDDPRVAAVLAKLRRDLLAEHLGVERHEVAAAEDQHDRLRAAIESLAAGRRTLRPLEVEEPALGELLEPLASLADPESPAAWPELLPDLRWFSDDD